MNTLVVVLCLSVMVYHGRVVQAQYIPCDTYFNKFMVETQEAYAAMLFQNDRSEQYRLTVTISIPGNVEKNDFPVTIDVKTSADDIMNGENIEYHVRYPYNYTHRFPLVTKLAFNGNIYCHGPTVRDEGNGVSIRSFTHDIHSTTVPRLIGNRTPNAPISVNVPRKFTTNCGKPDAMQSLIINGISTRSGEYPWLVALFYYNFAKYQYEFRCGGSLISKQFVITAAHCVKDGSSTIPTQYIKLMLGKHNIRTWWVGSTLRDVQTIHVHPNYITASDADISLLKMSQPVEYSTTIKPICLWSESSDLSLIVGKTGKVAGWGKDENGNPYVEQARQTRMPIVGQEDCRGVDARFQLSTSDRTFCAGYLENSSPCTGDSGGGFVLKRGDAWVLRGVVSSGLMDPITKLCDTKKYTVFADVAKMMDWIITTLGA